MANQQNQQNQQTIPETINCFSLNLLISANPKRIFYSNQVECNICNKCNETASVRKICHCACEFSSKPVLNAEDIFEQNGTHVFGTGERWWPSNCPSLLFLGKLTHIIKRNKHLEEPVRGEYNGS